MVYNSCHRFVSSSLFMAGNDRSLVTVENGSSMTMATKETSLATAASENEPNDSNAIKPEKQPEINPPKFDPADSRWYFTRHEIEINSPSSRDGIDSKREKYLRRSYCTFLETLGMALKLPQITIATAIVFCHRFYLRQSHCRNDRYLIATVCMFLAGKVEETPRSLKEVIQISFELRHKNDKDAAQRIKQREVFEEQKELLLLGERLLLSTLEFDLNVYHPYKPMIKMIKKFNLVQKSLPQMAWNFINDGLRTTLHLQFKPQQIAGGVILLSAKFLKVKLPIEKDEEWMEDFEATPAQLEEISSQLLEIYSHSKGGESRGSGPSSAANQRCKQLTSASQKGTPHSLKRSFSSRSEAISKPPRDSKSRNPSSSIVEPEMDEDEKRKRIKEMVKEGEEAQRKKESQRMGSESPTKRRKSESRDNETENVEKFSTKKEGEKDGRQLRVANGSTKVKDGEEEPQEVVDENEVINEKIDMKMTKEIEVKSEQVEEKRESNATSGIRRNGYAESSEERKGRSYHASAADANDDDFNSKHDGVKEIAS